MMNLRLYSREFSKVAFLEGADVAAVAVLGEEAVGENPGIVEISP
jgi:hypothetical protein